jgi:hypothetical protein
MNVLEGSWLRIALSSAGCCDKPERLAVWHRDLKLHRSALQAAQDVARWARDLAEDKAGELEREPACKQRQDCQDDQDYDDPEEQPRGAIHQDVTSRSDNDQYQNRSLSGRFSLMIGE